MDASEKTPQKKKKIENSSQMTNKASKQSSAKSDTALRQASAYKSNNTSDDESDENDNSSEDAMSVVDKQNESEEDSDDEKRRKRVEREQRRLSTPGKRVPTYMNKKITDDMNARTVFEATSGSNDSVDYYIWKKKNWKDGALVSSTPSPSKKMKQSPKTSSTKKSRWTKVGHKLAKKAISDYMKDGDAKVQKALLKKLKKNKESDEIRQIATDGIEFLEKVAYRTTPDFIVPIADKDVHKIITNADLKQYWSENVKCADIDEATKMRDDIESNFAKIRDDFIAQESIYADKVDLLNWRIARKANTFEPNMMAYRVLTHIYDHCDEDLGSGAEEEQPKEKSDEELGGLGSDDE